MINRSCYMENVVFAVVYQQSFGFRFLLSFFCVHRSQE